MPSRPAPVIKSVAYMQFRMYYAACLVSFLHMCTAKMPPVPDDYGRHALPLWQRVGDEAVRLHAVHLQISQGHFCQTPGPANMYTYKSRGCVQSYSW